MKRLSFAPLLSLLFTIIISGCAQWGGDNPLGITGGSGEGYGQNEDLNLPDPAGGNTIDFELVGLWTSAGRWVQTIRTIAFNANGTFTMVTHSGVSPQETEGTYNVSSNILTLNSDGERIIYIYSINGDYLTLNDGEQELLLLRINPQIVWYQN